MWLKPENSQKGSHQYFPDFKCQSWSAASRKSSLTFPKSYTKVLLYIPSSKSEWNHLSGTRNTITRAPNRGGVPEAMLHQIGANEPALADARVQGHVRPPWFALLCSSPVTQEPTDSTTRLVANFTCDETEMLCNHHYDGFFFSFFFWGRDWFINFVFVCYLLKQELSFRILMRTRKLAEFGCLAFREINLNQISAQ